MKNRKLSSKAVISLILSAVLFTMPAVAFSVNGNYAISAFAEETKETEESKPEESTEQTPGESETDVSTEENTENSTEGSTEETTEGSTEGSTEGGTEENTEGSTDESTGDGTVSGNDKPEPVCNCEDQCGAYEYDKNCPVCVTDYKLCTYKKDNIPRLCICRRHRRTLVINALCCGSWQVMDTAVCKYPADKTGTVKAGGRTGASP